MAKAMFIEGLDAERLTGLKSKTRKYRLIVGVVFVLLGLLYMMSVYWFLPQFAHKVISVSQESMKTETDAAIAGVKRFLSFHDQQGLKETVGELEKNGRDLGRVFGKLPMSELVSVYGRHDERMESLDESLRTLKETEKSYRSGVRSLFVDSEGKEVSVVPQLLEEAKKISENLKGIPPERVTELVSALVDLRRTHKNISTSSAKLIKNDGRTSEFKVWHDEDTKVAVQALLLSVDQVLDVAESSGVVARVRDVDNAVDATSTPSFQLVVARLDEIAKADVVGNFSKTGALLEMQVKSVKAMESGLTDVNKKLVPLQDGAGSLAKLTSELGQTASALKELGEGARRVVQSGERLQDIARTYQQAGSVSSGPMVFLVLALAGLITTLGISSLWKWVRSFDDERLEIGSLQRAQMLADLRRELGNDEKAVELVAIFGDMIKQGVQEEKRGGVLPTSKALSELRALIAEVKNT